VAEEEHDPQNHTKKHETKIAIFVALRFVSLRVVSWINSFRFVNQFRRNKRVGT